MKIVLVGINAKYIHTNLAVRSLRQTPENTGMRLRLQNTPSITVSRRFYRICLTENRMWSVFPVICGILSM